MKLSRSQLESLLDQPSLHYRGKDLIAVCPFCNSDTREFGISLEDNHLFNCFRKKACGVSGNIYSLLAHLGKSKEFLGERQVDIFQKLTSALEQEEGQIVQEIQLPEINPPALWQRVYEDPYLRERGFTDEQFEKFEVGRSKVNRDYVSFLVRQEGRLIGYVGRSDKNKKEIDRINIARKQKGEKEYPRYKNSTTDFAMTLFGYDEIVEGETTDIILVEGIFSKTKTDINLGLDSQNEIKCCATLGAKLSEYQVYLLKKKKVKRLIFWFEADVLSKIKGIVAKAALDFEVLVCYLSDKDPNDLSQEQALQLLSESRDWLEFNMSYV